MNDKSLLGYQSDSAAARNAFDLCMVEEERLRAKQGKPAVYNVLTGRFQSYESFYGSDETADEEDK